MKIKVFERFEDIEEVWCDFQKYSSGYPFQSYEWCYSWYLTIGKFLNAQPRIILVSEQDNTPIFLLPLVCKKRNGIVSLLTFDGGVSDYNAPLLHPDFSSKVNGNGFIKIWRRVVKELGRHDIIWLPKMPEKIGAQQNPFLHLKVRPNPQKSYSLSLNGTWDDFYNKKLKKKIRLDSRRQQKRLAQKGEIKFEVANTPGERRMITETMIKQKSRRYEETDAPNMFNMSCFREFYLLLAARDNNSVHISALKVGQDTVASHWGMIFNNIFYFLLPTYEGGDWRKYSCGRLLLEKLLETSYSANMSVFDFTIGGEDYKKNWCNQEMVLYDYWLVSNFKGRFVQAGEFLKSRLRAYPFLYNTVRMIFNKK